MVKKVPKYVVHISCEQFFEFSTELGLNTTAVMAGNDTF